MGEDGLKEMAKRGIPDDILTVSDLSAALKQGRVNVEQVPIDYVIMDGKQVIANTRSSTALIDAGVPRNLWYGRNKTGQVAYPNKTFVDLVQDQLDTNYKGNVANARTE